MVAMVAIDGRTRIASSHRPTRASRVVAPSYKFTSTKLRTVSPPTSSATCEPGEATTCTRSVAYGLGTT